jgi:dienelactone hydrolase
MKGKKILKYSLIAVAAILVVAVVGFLAWTRLARYPAFPEATVLAETATTPQGWYVFQPAQPTDTGFIFYPGGLVDPAAYAPLMKQLSDQGIMTAIVPMPLDLAIFGVNKASEVITTYPEIQHWIIGGHSLGGSMAAQYAKDNASKLAGIIFMGSYPANDMSQSPLQVVTLHGSLDGLATPAKITDSLKLLPPTSREVLIEGGNHAQYGNYGPQAGDGVATISREEQQQQTVTATLELVNQIRAR